MKYKVLIPTSGIGSRLGDITKYTNKSLVKIGKKPAISYIIEKYPKATEFVITLGYYGDHIQQFLEMAYPDRHFTFVNVDKFQGPGTSLGYSMLQAKNELQCPFIYNACDTITFDNIKEPSTNWVAGYNTSNLSQYDSYDVSADSIITNMFEKGEIRSDFAYVGLIGVNDYKSFWNQMEKLYIENPEVKRLSDFWCINSLVQDGTKWNHTEINSWYDIGNVQALQKARDEFPDKFPILDKVKESIYLFDDFVIKFFSDEDMVTKRVKRAQILEGLTPSISGKSKNFYKYQYAHGDLFSDVAIPRTFIELVEWATKNLWKPVEFDATEHKKLCFDFYYKKTDQRITEFMKNRNDQIDIINGETVPTLTEMFREINHNWLCESKPVRYHGDFILDNIIKPEHGFVLLDWRQDFAGNIEVGDMYYDLAKLNHNLTVNHDIVSKDLFSITKRNGEVNVDIHRKQTLIECQQKYHAWIVDNGYDLSKVKALTAIIWLNMAALHHKPFDEFLYFFGKYNLYKTLKETKNGYDPKFKLSTSTGVSLLPIME